MPRQHVLLKLENFGIRGPLLNWISHFLTQRELCAVVEVEKSRHVAVGSGDNTTRHSIRTVSSSY
ncbi:hypothetical protein DPMN_160222 [Dreissena polymorpha]|uniref:Uncharacterized protein n=1 Tax=Dreissena polymorpha TaxID=45954 RepID=A0A9D4EQP6_DREPO|nr:hypothetical protein DPMN_160222 [Dreissena polymorpha]